MTDTPLPPGFRVPDDAVSDFMVSVLEGADDIARRYMRQRFLPGGIAVESKGDKGGRPDFVTAADKEIQAFVEGKIKERFPQDGFLGEESDLEKTGQNNVRWILDPIDGTSAFQMGIAHWACCVLARQEKHDGKWVFTHSVMSEPANGRAYLADASGAYFKNPNLYDDQFRRLDLLRASASEKKTVLGGMSVEVRLVNHETAETIARDMMRAGNKCSPRSQGAIAPTLALCGLSDKGKNAILCGGIDIWDWAAPVHLLEKVGYHWDWWEPDTTLRDKKGNPYHVLVVAEDPAVIAELKRITEESLALGRY